MKFEIGSIVKPTKESGYVLACGSGWYSEAVVISDEPFILTSIEADMKWQATIKKENFELIGNVNEDVLNRCLKRLN